MAPTDPDSPLVDTALADEIALLGDLMAAAGAVARPLTPEEIDRALGLGPEPTGGAASSDG